MFKNLISRSAAALALLGLLAVWPARAAGTISLTTLGVAYTQNFDTLAPSGTSSTVPNGWDFLESDTSANTLYTGGNGSSNTGDTYSLGFSGSTPERAFGGLQSGSLNTTVGANFANNTGSTLGELTISYTGEQWRLGATGRADRLDFQYSLNATSLGTGTWTDYNALDFVAPNSTGTVGALDGNLAANRVALTATLTGLNIPNGATFWIRWSDFNASSNDDALGVDDFSLTPGAAIPTADLTTAKTGPVTTQPGAPITYTLTFGNSGVLTATTTVVTDTLPTGVDFVTYTTALPHTFSQPTAQQLVWDFGDLAPSATGLSITVYGSVSAPLNTPLTNTLQAATTTTETVLANNTATATTFVGTLCSGVFTPTYTIQGTGASTAYSGTILTTQGVVVGDFQEATQLSGFYIQDTTGDGLTQTSDGLFVYAPTAPSLSVGDLVRVTGTATEFFNITELGNVTNVTLCDSGQNLAPTVMPLPVPTFADFETYEGMLVTFPQTITVDQNYFQGRYGQITVSGAGRLYHPNNGNGLGDTVDYNLRRMLIVDDGSTTQNPNPIPYMAPDNTLRAGDVITGLTGVLDYGLITADSTTRHYKLHPTAPVNIIRVNERTLGPNAVGGNLRVASFNVLNYFNTLDASGSQCYPSNTQGDCRGANTATEFTRQRTKIITALVALNADVVGLMEMENDGEGANSAIQDLVNGLNAVTASGTYTFVHEALRGPDAIKVAIIYQSARVTPVGAAQNYQVTNHPSYNPLYDRPPLAQTFMHNSTGEKFTVIVNHFKSKGSCPNSGPDLDLGQGCWNAKRTAQSTALLTFISQMQTSAGDNDVLVMGDLNSYGEEDPIDVFTNAGFMNEVAHWIPAEDRYSYVFDGAAGYLDHLLASASLHAQTTGATHWHINADEPVILDYNQEFRPPSPDLYTPTAYKASDHDPALLGVSLLPTAPMPSYATSSHLVNTTTVPAGSILTYTLTLTNNGTASGTFMLTDTLPAGVIVLNSGGLSVSGNTLTGAGTLNQNAQITYLITVRVAPTFSGNLIASATLTGDGVTRTLTAPTVTVLQRFWNYLPRISK